MLKLLPTYQALLVLILLKPIGYCQTGFEKVYEVNNRTTVITDAKLVNGYIYAAGLMTDTFPTSVDVPMLLKLDLNGNVLDTIYKRLNSTSYYVEKSLLQLSNNEFVMVGNYGNALTGAIYHFSTDSLVDLYTFSDTTTALFAFKDIIRHTSGDYYVMVWQADTGTLDINAVILRLDSSFNEIWRIKYGVTNRNEIGGCLSELLNGNIILGSCKGYWVYPSAWNPYPYPQFPTWMMIFDSSGAVINQLSDPDTAGYYPGDIIQLPDHGYLYCGAYLYGYLGSNTPYFQSYLCRRDSLFNKIWERKLGNGATPTTMIESMKIHDNKIFCVGHETNNPPNDDYGSLYCFDMNGHMLYKRYFLIPAPLNSQIIGNDSKYFYSLDIPNDSTIIIAGQVMASVPINIPSQWGWVVKTNIYGCLVDTGSFHYFGIESEDKHALESILIYPNPINSEFMVQIPDELLNDSFTITNSLGQMVQKGVLESNLTIFDSQNYLSGIYYFSIYDSEKIITRCYKLIKS